MWICADYRTISRSGERVGTVPGAPEVHRGVPVKCLLQGMGTRGGGPLHILCVLFCWLQIAVLKENVAKADLEIAELDKLVDHVREVCHLIPAVFGHFLFPFVCISLCTLAITVYFCIPLVR